jgi:hypothetical protein
VALGEDVSVGVAVCDAVWLWERDTDWLAVSDWLGVGDCVTVSL